MFLSLIAKGGRTKRERLLWNHNYVSVMKEHVVVNVSLSPQIGSGRGLLRGKDPAHILTLTLAQTHTYKIMCLFSLDIYSYVLIYSCCLWHAKIVFLCRSTGWLCTQKLKTQVWTLWSSVSILKHQAYVPYNWTDWIVKRNGHKHVRHVYILS